MWDRYGNVAAMLAAYNAGPGRYDDHRSTGRPLPAETRAYVAALLPLIGGAAPTDQPEKRAEPPPDWREAPLFIRRAVEHVRRAIRRAVRRTVGRAKERRSRCRSGARSCRCGAAARLDVRRPRERRGNAMSIAAPRSRVLDPVCSQVGGRLAAYLDRRAEREERTEGKIKETGTLTGRFLGKPLAAHCFGTRRTAPCFWASRAAIWRKALALLGFDRHYSRISAVCVPKRHGMRP